MQVTELICMNCKHFREFEGGCDAFPDGIPEIIIETNEHNKPLPEQKNNIIYEPLQSKKDTTY